MTATFSKKERDILVDLSVDDSRRTCEYVNETADSVLSPVANTEMKF